MKNLNLFRITKRHFVQSDSTSCSDLPKSQPWSKRLEVGEKNSEKDLNSPIIIVKMEEQELELEKTIIRSGYI